MKSLLISKGVPNSISKKHKIGYGQFSISSDFQVFSEEEKKMILIGYVQPRKKEFQQFETLSQSELVFNLYRLYQLDLVYYIKGVFNIIIFDKNEIVLINDHLGLKKLFKYEMNNMLLISNNFKLMISQINDLKINHNAISKYAIFNHYVNQETYVKGVSFLKGGNIYTTNNNVLTIKSYWRYSNLLNLKKEKKSFADYSKEVKTIIDQIIKYQKPKDHLISLTGGKDSRTILAGLMSLGINPKCFTYGNENSSDNIYAKKISKGLSLNHKILSNSLSNDDLFLIYNRIIKTGNPLINIHRAHRLYAFEQIAKQQDRNTLFWGGYLGGELLMGMYYDDLIFTKLVKDKILNKKSIDVNYLEELLSELFIHRLSKEKLGIMVGEIKKMSFYTHNNELTSELAAILDIGVLHHYQDIELMSQQVDLVMPLFIDIDFLQLIFESPWSLLDANNKTKNLFLRHKLFKFNLNIQHILSPQLSKYYFAKKGSFNTNEFIRYFYFLPFIRAFRRLFKNKSFSNPMHYDEDYHIEVLRRLEIINRNKDNSIHQIYDIEKAINCLKENSIGNTEKYLQRFTNIITLANQIDSMGDFPSVE